MCYLKVFILSAVSGLLMICSLAFAGDPVSLNVTGNIVAAPCDISSDSLSQTVDLGNGSPIQAINLQTPGSATDWVPFKINLINCHYATSTATIQFNGTPDANEPADMYQNAGTATNIAIQVQGPNGEQFGNGKTFTKTIVDNACTYDVQARVYSKDGKVQAGTIRAVMTTTFTYQ